MKAIFNNAAELKAALLELYNKNESTKAQIFAISGIEGGGKRALSEKVAEGLTREGARVAVVHTDDWEAAKSIRFNVMNSPEEYYLNAYRFDEMFEELILPLKLFGSIKTSVTLDDVMNPRTVEYDFNNVDIIIIEGVYLLQEAYLNLYDYTCWVVSDYDAAFERLVSQNDVEQSQQALVNLFENLIKPAEQYHINADHPQINAKSIYIEQETGENTNDSLR